MHFNKLIITLVSFLLILSLSGCSLLPSFLPRPYPAEATAPSDAPTAGFFHSNNTQIENTQTPQASNKQPLNLIKADNLNLTLAEYNGGFYTIQIPQNWAVETTGEYESFGFRIYDPTRPQRQMFFYGNMSPFLKSSEAKQAWQTYLATGGFGNAQLYADAPVLAPATTAQFFNTFAAFTEFAANYGISHNFPVFNALDIVETMPRNSPIAGVALDDSIVRALFTNNGLPCQGLFAASVVDAMTSYMYNVDAGYYTVYVISGISAPTEEFTALEPLLAQALSTFTFSQEYINNGVAQNQWETNAALQVAKTLSDAYDSYNQAWTNRQQTYDVLSQKNSDATLGYDRLYNPETGEVYRAELGFYDQYDTNREDYTTANLQLVPDNAYDLYGTELSGYIYKN